MKNIEFEQLEQYNINFENKDILDRYMQVNMAHLQEDMRKCKKYVSTFNRLDALMKKCSEIHLKVLHKQKLEERHFEMFEEINNYNAAKNKELKIIAVLAVVFSIVAIFTTLFLQ